VQYFINTSIASTVKVQTHWTQFDNATSFFRFSLTDNFDPSLKLIKRQCARMHPEIGKGGSGNAPEHDTLTCGHDI
jgi:hypothetical protein